MVTSNNDETDQPGHANRSPEELRATAYHEAGHAVVAVALGLGFNSASIDPKENVLGHLTHPSLFGYHFSNNREKYSLARKFVLISYAGIPAQRLVDPNPWEHHGAYDEDSAREICHENGLGPNLRPGEFMDVNSAAHAAYRERLRKEAARLVRKQRAAVEAFAEALLQHITVDGETGERLIEPLLVK